MKHQKGYALFGTIVGMVLLSIVGGAVAYALTDARTSISTDDAVSKYRKVSNALIEYAKHNSTAILSASSSVSGVADKWNPTIDELKTLKYLDATTPVILGAAGKLGAHILPIPQGCNAAANECNLDLQAYPAHGFPDAKFAATVLSGLGGMSGATSSAGGMLVGWQGKYQIQSPVAESNFVVARSILPTAMLSNAISKSGADALTGDWAVGGKAINSIDTLQTKQLKFNTMVTEGDACTSENSLAMGSDGVVQTCKGGVWSAAMTTVQTIVNRTVHLVRNCGGTTVPASQQCPSGGGGCSSRPGGCRSGDPGTKGTAGSSSGGDGGSSGGGDGGGSGGGDGGGGGGNGGGGGGGD